MAKSGYDVYLKKYLLPITPEQISIKINNANKTVTLINEGQINIIKKPELTDIEFECMIPQVKYPFAKYKKNKFKNAKYFLNHFEKLKKSKKPFQFIVSRKLPNDKKLFNTNIKVTLEDYKIVEDAKNGFDLMVKIKLKQYRSYSTKTVKIRKPGEIYLEVTPTLTLSSDKKRFTASQSLSRDASNAPSGNRVHTVLSGDCLWGIAKKAYGDGSLYTVIRDANKSILGESSEPVAGQVLTIPEV